LIRADDPTERRLNIIYSVPDLEVADIAKIWAIAIALGLNELFLYIKDIIHSLVVYR
jgi:hypothetical protein